MLSGYFLMLAAGNFGHLFNDPRWFVGYWFCVPIGFLIDTVFVVKVTKSN